MIYPPTDGPTTRREEEGRFAFHWKQGPGSNETAYVQALRLPPGAKLLSSEPKPAESRGNGGVTLIWRTVLAAHEFFECTVEYDLSS